jgi:hypothetical protein
MTPKIDLENKIFKEERSGGTVDWPQNLQTTGSLIAKSAK